MLKIVLFFTWSLRKLNFLASSNRYGAEAPIALRLIACMLLMEITAFLRETYQSLPKACRNTIKERPPQWERMYNRGDANRRWSMALSSMGHSQTSAQSLQSIAGDKDPGKPLIVFNLFGKKSGFYFNFGENHWHSFYTSIFSFKINNNTSTNHFKSILALL